MSLINILRRKIPLSGVFFILFLILLDVPKLANLYLTETILSLYLLISWKNWSKPFTGKIYLFIIIMGYSYAQKEANTYILESIFSMYGSVFWLLLGIGLLRNAMAKLGVQELFNHLFSSYHNKNCSLIISTFTLLSTMFLSLASIPVMIDNLKEATNNTNAMAALVARIVSITITILPITIGAATVFTTVKSVVFIDTILVGTPIFIMGVLLAQNKKINFICHKNNIFNKKRFDKYFLFYLILFPLVNFVLVFYFNLSIIKSLGLITGVGFFLVSFILKINMQPLKTLNDVSEKISKEVVLLLACSFLAFYVTNNIEGFSFTRDIQLYIFDFFGVYFYIFLILCILPIFGFIGIHPLLIFSISYPILSNFLGDTAVSYLIWICFFINTQLISPVSINAILTANSLQISSFKTSYRMHIKYVSVFSIISLLYLSILFFLY